MRNIVLSLLGLCAASAAGATAHAQIHRVAEMNTRELAALDRAHTVVLLTSSILEEHGPYLPSFTDGYNNHHVAVEVARAIVARRGWHVLEFPDIPLGNGGANIIGGKFSFPGSYNVRASTLRAMFMDIADALGAQGFRWVFVISGHGAPNHNRMLDQASDYFHDTYGGTMVHLTGIEPPESARAPSALLDAKQVAENGFSVHAGVSEHSEMMFLQPQLVADTSRARAITGRDFADLVRIARSDSWPGYFGSPRLASAAIGAEMAKRDVDLVVKLALGVLDGMDVRRLPRHADVTSRRAASLAVDRAAFDHDAEAERRQQRWLQQHAASLAIP